MHLFPRSWQCEFGDEFAALLDDTPMSPPAAADVVRSAVVAHVPARFDLLVWLLATVAVVCCETLATRAGVTRNILRPPTTPVRGAYLVATLAPIALTLTRTSPARS